MIRLEIYDPSFIPDDSTYYDAEFATFENIVTERLSSPLYELLADLMIECELAAKRFEHI